MIIIVQEIVSWWTKASRGGSGAGRRNAVPEALPLAAVQPEEAYALPLVHQRTFFSEQSDFVPTLKLKIEDLTQCRKLTAACTEFTFKDNLLAAKYIYRETWVGAPARSAYPKTLTLRIGEWGRIMFNGRFSWESDWSYQKVVLNIALLDQFSKDLFLITPPIRTISDIANLW